MKYILLESSCTRSTGKYVYNIAVKPPRTICNMQMKHNFMYIEHDNIRDNIIRILSYEGACVFNVTVAWIFPQKTYNYNAISTILLNTCELYQLQYIIHYTVLPYSWIRIIVTMGFATYGTYGPSFVMPT